MKKMRLFGVTSVALTLALLPTLARADVGPMPNPGYEIEAKTLYCAHGGTDCTTPARITDLRFVAVTIFSYTPGDADARPQLVNLVCGRHYIDSSGNPHIVSIGATVGPPSLQDPTTGVHSGDIDGRARVANAAETSAAARATVDLHVYDDATKTTAEVEGTDRTNNLVDYPQNTLVSGGFKLELEGTIVDQNTVTGAQTTSRGEMTCHSGVTPVAAPFAPPPIFENVLGDTDGDAGS